jgi:DNA invertase Pin-like site-specific DNA recombinase
MIAAIYARKSTDDEEEKAVPRELEQMDEAVGDH